MKIIKKEKLYTEYNNSNMTVSVYWEQVQKDKILSQEELIAAKTLTNNIYNLRKNKYIDTIFIDMFKVDNINNTANLANQLGADIGGIESQGVKAIIMNSEFGVNICLNEPKSEDVHKYLKIFELFHLGLENVEQYRKVLAFYHLDETLDQKPKSKQNKI